MPFDLSTLEDNNEGGGSEAQQEDATMDNVAKEESEVMEEDKGT